MSHRDVKRRSKWGTVFAPTAAPLSKAALMGVGYTGSMLAAELLGAGVDTHIVTRRNHAGDDLVARGATRHVIDLDANPAPEGFAFAAGVCLYYLVPPSAGFVEDNRLRRTLAAMESAPPSRLVLVSTTGVYGDAHGNWIDERETPAPATDRGRRRLDAEHAARAFAASMGCGLTILRVAAIYGPGALPLARLRRNDPLPPANETGFTNRIHVLDLVQSLMRAGIADVNGSVINVCDGAPLRMREWFELVADQAGLPAPPELTFDEARQKLSPAFMDTVRESRRIHNNRLVTELGVSLRFADPVAGIRQALGQG